MEKPAYFDELAELIKPRSLIWYPAAPSNYGYMSNGQPVVCRPRAMCWHTPEETADKNEVTPVWFQNPKAIASTHFYSDNDGDLYHMVSLDTPPYANGVRRSNRTWKGKRLGWAPWNSDHLNYNWITASCEVEGFGRSMDVSLTLAQWETCMKLGWWVGQRFGFPADRVHHFEHREVCTEKTDPGTFPTNLLVEYIARYVPTETALPGLPKITKKPARKPAAKTWSPEMERHIKEYHARSEPVAAPTA